MTLNLMANKVEKCWKSTITEAEIRKNRIYIYIKPYNC